MSSLLRARSLWGPALATSALLIVLLVSIPPAVPRSGTAALRVQLDPESGQLVPASGLDKTELDRQLGRMLNRSAAGLPEVRHSDGGVSVDLEGRFQSLSVATTDREGHVHTGCVTSSREWEHFQGAATDAAAPNR